MRGIRGTVPRLLFGAAVAGALGFGATQALAAPAPAARAAACDWRECLELCGPEWYCNKDGTCHCGG